ncbi:hypothetical protein BSKO_10512 [Bryopsis sp. KO-2023]|nr:hypothetical protein BSKO_10512 [Bryopsis sp. KO-2023]
MFLARSRLLETCRCSLGGDVGGAVIRSVSSSGKRGWESNNGKEGGDSDSSGGGGGGKFGRDGVRVGVNEEGEGNKKAKVNGSGGAADGHSKTIKIPAINSVVAKSERKRLKDPPLESLDIYDTVTDLTREAVEFWKGFTKKGPEAAVKLDESLVRLHRLIKKKRRSLDHVSVAMMVHQLASICTASRMGHWVVRHAFLKDLLTLADEFREDFDVNQIANVMWGLGKMGPHALFVRLGDGERTAKDLVRSLAVLANASIGDFTPLAICQVLYGLAVLSPEFPEQEAFVELLAAVAKQQLSGFSTQGISVLFVALAKLDHVDRLYLIPAMCKRVEDQIVHFKRPQQLCNIAWGLAKMRRTNSFSLLNTIVARATATFDQFHLPEITMLLWAFYKLRFYPGDEFLQQAEIRIRKMCDRAKPQEISNTLLALADFGSYAPDGSMSKDLIEDLKAALKKPVIRGPDIETQHLTNAVWSLAILDQLDINMLNWILDSISTIGRRLNPVQKRQIYQSLIPFTLFEPKLDLKKTVPPSLLQVCQSSWQSKQKDGVVIPPMVEVFNVLRKIGYKCESKMVGGEMISASTAVNTQGVKVAVEIDTPMRCFRNVRDRRLGRYLWRERMLEGSGWMVLRVRLDEWIALEGMSPRLEYLKAGLANANSKGS